MAATGTVKSFNPMKGFGFITQADGTDVFVHASSCGGAVPVKGDEVVFDIEPSQKGGAPSATNVIGCTGDASAKGKGKGKGSGSCTGTVKSFVHTKGWGFVTMEGHEGTDIFLHIKNCQDGQPEVGDAVTFDVEDTGRGDGTLKAMHVYGCSGGWGKGGFGKWGGGKMGGKGKGGPYGGKGGKGKGGWGMDPWSMMAAWCGGGW